MRNPFMYPRLIPEEGIEVGFNKHQSVPWRIVRGSAKGDGELLVVRTQALLYAMLAEANAQTGNLFQERKTSVLA